MAEKINIIWIILIIAITLGIYFNYYSEPTTTAHVVNNLPNETNSTPSGQVVEIVDNFSGTNYLHFGHMPITYFITEDECGSETQTIMEAFDIIEETTSGMVNFDSVNSKFEADIKIECKPVGTYESGTQTLGEAFFYNEENLITSAEITYYVSGPKEFRVIDYCESGFPRTEVHEILHVFGFGHNNRGVNIMKMINTAGKCAINKINNEYRACLKHIYSNGEILTSCDGIPFTDPESFFEYGDACADGWYLAKTGDFCCPEPDMIIDDDGYCV